ncbi:hypothetical protein BSIN_5181 [Burkholderia singularis]|uniref:Uncharacterized protein n=2 Tax=Burkholderia singularis TaxID=1503053 RepID=A0A238HDD8_9BURK|nr:hypothetical protein BSIN_5181 [Burkholderia singularis]
MSDDGRMGRAESFPRKAVHSCRSTRRAGDRIVMPDAVLSARRTIGLSLSNPW